MDYSDYSSSPDPIVLPSSPPSGHARYRLDGNEGRRTKSPAKTFIIDTPAGARGKSPFRIRLTVEPQSDSGSAASIERSDTIQQSRYQKSPIRESRRTASVLPEASVEPPSTRSTRKRKRENQPAEDDDVRARLAVPTPSKSLRQTRSPRDGSSARIQAGNHVLDDEAMGEHTLANEDFTMISGDSLASIKANNSVLGGSHRALQPQPALEGAGTYHDEIIYPLLDPPDSDSPDEIARPPSASAVADTRHQPRDYDAMSWQPTHQDQTEQQLQDELLASQTDVGVLDEDIWAEEASRSLGEDAHDVGTADFVPPIFSDETQPPPRSKIPKTWRKASGVDISYSDSPAQVNARPSSTGADPASQQSAVRSSTGPRAQSAIRPPGAFAQSDDNALDDSELTNPDAAATQLQTQSRDVHSVRPSLQTPRQMVHGVNSPSADETGLFWHTDRKTLFSKGPLRPRYQREELPDLSRILNTHTPGSAKALANATGTETNRSRQQHHRSTLSSQQLPSEQLRPKSRLVQVASHDHEPNGDDQTGSHRQDGHNKQPQDTSIAPSARLSQRSLFANHDRRPQAIIKSQAAVASLRSAHPEDAGLHHKQRTYGRRYFGRQQADRAAVDEDDEVTDEQADPSHSYEEHLNRLSPGKLKVNFQDSSAAIVADDRLKPTRAYPSLFGAGTSTAQHRQQTQQLEDASLSDEEVEVALDRARKTSVPLSPEAEPGLMSRLASTFWSAFTRPVYNRTEVELLADELPSFPPTLRARIRARYGVLQEQHPWTMMHMRTLHRMVKSVLTRRSESIIPTTLRLPQFLDDIIDSSQGSATGGTFDFSFEHACAIWSFMQILVPLSLVRAMERGEVEWLGDEITKSYRGRIAGRWGAELCFRTVSTPEGLIHWPWLVACLGSVLYAEDMTDEQGFDDVNDDE